MTDRTNSPRPAGDGERVSEDQAKQGRVGAPVVVVLAASLALVVIAFVAVYLLQARPTSDSRPGAAAARSAAAQRSTP